RAGRAPERCARGSAWPAARRRASPRRARAGGPAGSAPWPAGPRRRGPPSPPPPAAAWLLVSNLFELLFGLVPGQREEHVVQAGAAELQVSDLDRRGVQVADEAAQLPGPVRRRPGQAALPGVERGLPDDVPPDHLGGDTEVSLLGDRDLDAVAPDLALELVRRALGDHPSGVDDRDPVGQLV